MSAATWIAQRRELIEAATEGPWETDGFEITQHWSLPEPWKTVASNEIVCMAYCYGGSARGIEHEDDARFIADARTSLPRALDALEAALALAKGHRDWATKRGRDACICTVCGMCRAVESALRADR